MWLIQVRILFPRSSLLLSLIVVLWLSVGGAAVFFEDAAGRGLAFWAGLLPPETFLRRGVGETAAEL